ncbi:MAG: hypothetical protein N2422_02135 [Rhodobacteraceae bacterium]|nr:hypothetical protein [Paracoccaceae bacterium]
MGFLISGIAGAGTRLFGWGLGLALWLISRPGGWAVLVVLTLLALRWFPEGAAAD